MKKLLSIFLLALALVSCNKAKTISVSESSVTFPISGGEQTVKVTADGSWSVNECPDWVKVQTTDEAITFVVGQNTTGAKREWTAFLQGADGVVTPVVVAQVDRCTHITASPAEVSLPKDGGSVDVAIDTDGGNLDVQVSDGITASYNDGKLTVTAPANEGGTTKGEITIKCDAVSTIIPVTIEGSMCQRCKGTGKITCPKCGGKGFFYDGDLESGCTRCGGGGTGEEERDGRGRIPCPDCGGAGH